MGLFGGSSKTKIVDMTPEWKKKGSESLYGAAGPGAEERVSSAGKAYPGELVAGMSTGEQMGQETLEDYLRSPLPTEGGAMRGANEELEKTLGGNEYDPVGGTYYQAYRTAVLRELREAKDRLGARTSASEKFFGGGRIKEEGNLEEGATNTLALELGRLYEGERDRRLGAVPMAQDMARTEEGLTQGRIASSQQFGALERELEQAGLGAEYAEWIRQVQDSGVPLEVALQLITGYQQDLVAKGGGAQKDVGGGILSGALTGFQIGGPWGALAGGAIGGAGA